MVLVARIPDDGATVAEIVVVDERITARSDEVSEALGALVARVVVPLRVWDAVALSSREADVESRRPALQWERSAPGVGVELRVPRKEGEHG